MKRKMVNFNEELFDLVESFATEHGLQFADAVNKLVLKGLKPEKENNENDKKDSVNIDFVLNKIDGNSYEIEELKKNTGWFKADDTQSRLGNVEIDIKELSKKLVNLYKLFKKHINSKEIHLDENLPF